MLLAELEVRHSRPVAPTRRVALGLHILPTEPAPGWGGVLLGALVCANLEGLEPDDIEPLYDLIDDLEAGERISQPRLRHRFQVDTVGLDRSRHSLVGEGELVWFDFDDRAHPAVNVLGALYAAATVEGPSRPPVFRAIRKSIVWEKPLGDEFVAHLLGDDASFSRWRALPTDERWALKLFGFSVDERPSITDIQARFRLLLWNAHPDHGGDEQGAGQRVTELTQARKILFDR